MKRGNQYTVIGMMSGTSLDGLDVACCRFEKRKTWKFQILSSKTYPYPEEWNRKLAEAHEVPGDTLMALHAEYGRYLGKVCRQFMRRNKTGRVDFIASHGHTVFHQPEKKFTFQLGDGVSLHAVTGLPVVWDFRTLDVALGGEGAPLVPIGDQLLFSEYDVCLNLGGIANLSMDIKRSRRAFDVCFCNMGLNYLAGLAGLTLDENGRLAMSGKIHGAMLDEFNTLYRPLRKARPSIGRERFERMMRPILDNSKVMVKDRIRTLTESIALEIVEALPSLRKGSQMLVTGGGAFNSFLVSRIEERLSGKVKVVVPVRGIVEFKEALLFAFLGVLRVKGDINTLRSVTHATRDSSGGCMIGF